jgi:cholesterol transport system auxiliary component
MKHGLAQLGHGILFFLVCSACVNLERDAPERHYFVIELPRSADQGAPSGDDVLMVSNLRISPRYADRSFVYRTSDAGYESDYYNQFLASPDVMISEELRKGLAASSQFKFVVGPANPLPPNYALEGSINSLYGDFRNAAQPAAVLEMDFFLYRENSNSQGVVLQKRYVKSVSLNAKSPEALVKGWDQALREIIAALAADLKVANL